MKASGGQVAQDWHIGVDVGGTFTDVILYNHSGLVRCYKFPSTPKRPAMATLQAIDHVIRNHNLDANALSGLSHTHGSTIAVNTLIERTGATLGLITTRGFRDLLHFGRLAIPHPMRFDSRRPASLIPRELCAEVSGRLAADGQEVEPVNPADVHTITDEFVRKGVGVIVVCCLNSYRNSAHERQIREIILARYPNLMIDISSEVWAQAREYERAILTSINSYVRPAMREYIADLMNGLALRGLLREPGITRSNGGKQRAITIRERPIAAFLSGPAGGVVAAASVAAEAGLPQADLITVDVGGTSADVGVVRKGKALLSADEHIAHLPLIAPTIAVSSVGAGGGSRIWVDEAGNLKVGPRSVGSDPGPASYGAGGLVPALTDAFVISGWLADGNELGEGIRLKRDLAVAAFSPVAAQLEVSIEELTQGAIAIAVAILAAEVSNVLSRRGVDAPEFVLVPFGGAGPLLGALLADEVGIRKILIPPTPGALSAVGAASANVEGDLVAPIYMQLLDIETSGLPAVMRELTDRATEWLSKEEEAITVLDREFTVSGDMRYAGQGYDVTVPLKKEWLEQNDTAKIAEEFHAAHLEAYGHNNPAASIWLSELRLHVIGATSKPRPTSAPNNDRTPEQKSREIYLSGQEVTARVYQRSDLGNGTRIVGPAIVQQYDTTVLLPPGWEGVVARSGSLIMTTKR